MAGELRTNEDAYQAGIALMTKMMGAAAVEKNVGGANDFTTPLQDAVVQNCFGTVWQRAPLDHKTRSMLTIAMLAAMGRTPQLKAHVVGAISNGVTPEEIREILLHAMVYCGVPLAFEATMAADEVLSSMDK